eukprot:546329-Amphidinium_carterae.1
MDFNGVVVFVTCREDRQRRVWILLSLVKRCSITAVEADMDSFLKEIREEQVMRAGTHKAKV